MPSSEESIEDFHDVTDAQRLIDEVTPADISTINTMVQVLKTSRHVLNETIAEKILDRLTA